MNFTSPYPNNPATCFAADAQDIVCTDAFSGQFVIVKNNMPILSEWYDKDADNRIVIRGLADIFSTALFGTLSTGSQPNASAELSLIFDNATIWTGTVHSMRIRNPRDPNGQKQVLAANTEGTAYVGQPCILTDLQNGAVDYAQQIAAADGDTYTVGGEVTLHIVRRQCPDAVCVRFLNRYDAPQSVVAQWMEEKPNVTDSVDLMSGRRTRFSVESSTEYTLHSGPLVCDAEYDAWADLLSSRMAEILMHGQWIPVVVSKSNYTRRRRRFYGNDIQISFTTQDPNIVL